MVTLHPIERQPSASSLHTTEELAAALGPFAKDYAATIRLTRDLPPSDARRMLSKVRGRYLRLLRASIRTATWLAGEEAAS